MKKEEMKNIAPKLAALKNSSEMFILPKDALENTELGVLAQLKELQLKERIGNKNPFKVHPHYFENFEDTFEVSFNEIKIDSLKSTLKVPENYFDSVEQNVLLKLKSIPKEKEVKIFSLRSRVFKLSVTAAVAASIALVFIFNRFQQSKESSFDSLALSDIENWIDQDYLKLDAYQIAAVYTDVQVQPNLLNTLTNEEEMEDFLSHENIDLLMYEE